LLVMITLAGVILPLRGVILLTSYSMWSWVKTWVSWTDDDGAWAPQSPWRRRLLDHRCLFWLVSSFALSFLLLAHEGVRGSIGGVELLLVIGCRWCPFLRTFSACSMALPEPPFGVRRSIWLASGCRWSLMDRFRIVLVGGSVSHRPFRLSYEASASVGVVSLHGGGWFCQTLADFACHPVRYLGAVLAGGLHGGGFEVSASLLVSSCEVWILVGCV
jgi:hypothetical protein